MELVVGAAQLGNKTTVPDAAQLCNYVTAAGTAGVKLLAFPEDALEEGSAGAVASCAGAAGVNVVLSVFSEGKKGERIQSTIFIDSTGKQVASRKSVLNKRGGTGKDLLTVDMEGAGKMFVITVGHVDPAATLVDGEAKDGGALVVGPDGLNFAGPIYSKGLLAEDQLCPPKPMMYMAGVVLICCAAGMWLAREGPHFTVGVGGVLRLKGAATPPPQQRQPPPAQPPPAPSAPPQQQQQQQQQQQPPAQPPPQPPPPPAPQPPPPPASPYPPPLEQHLRDVASGAAAPPANGPYFRRLAAALLAAPAAIAARRAPYACDCGGGARFRAHPISFSVPEELFRAIVPAKSQNFSTVVPGLQSTYKFRADGSKPPREVLAAEAGYYADMARSLFAVTYKKGGWDCLRHPEIVAAGALPLFTDIKGLPPGTMAAHPTEVYALLNEWPGLEVRGLPGTPPGAGATPPGGYFSGQPSSLLKEDVDREMYQLVALALLSLGHATISTRAMAAWLAGTVGIKPDDAVLYVTDDEPGADYQSDTLLHGLRAVVPGVVDWPRRPGMYVGPGTFTEAELASDLLGEYGQGFGYAHRLPEPYGIDRTRIEERIASGAFDYAIVSMTHDPRTTWRRLMPAICAALPRGRVVFVNGGDLPGPGCGLLPQLAACSDWVFLREMEPACKPPPPPPPPTQKGRR
ncbi:hypothetical protein Rsub_12598 [Raphidocelis subcapitata]|uniref:Uncharacterized protein n=1 Tax=Raphidocelis subcapitata TaxID=307507 RepID=A0A2V0PIU4_9CHLO|nr:hypothetical protein Rsub_12598 [Raphidocelis subcapitata]|eukprot:GBF98952.1 hypothetical protein Rsub_12598 [Raphidocelis subcapitata]